MTKDLYENNQIKIDRIVKDLNESLIYLRNSVKSEGFHKNKNPNKIIDIVENNPRLQ